jgi:hypothetical protein
MTTNEEKPKKIGVMPFGIAITLIIAVFLAYNLFEGDRSYFLAGQTSHGHYQIELVCESCHSSPFAGKEAMQEACESCHSKELDWVDDSHPKKVFLDPRNAELLDTLDARYCVSCHREHKPEITRRSGVTLAADFCFHCHSKIAEERPSHQSFEFNTCASSGCHNFHDNSMLYEKFLGDHLNEANILAEPLLPQKTGLEKWLKKHKKKHPLETAAPDLARFSDAAFRNSQGDLQKLVEDWQLSIHAKTEANCSSCHISGDAQADETQLAESFKISEVEKVCKDCHSKQHEAFLESRHGMRIAQNMQPMSTDKARLKFVTGQAKSLDCNSCHNPHSLNVNEASMDACLGCHQDEHSVNWQKELQGELPVGSGVNCASCHLPKNKKGKNVTVVHNQNLNLRPNTKMLKDVCMSCHGLEFSLASLADRKLIENNFQGIPLTEHQSIELIKERLKERQKEQN